MEKNIIKGEKEMKNESVFNLGKFFSHVMDLQIEYNIKQGKEAPNQLMATNFYERVANGSMSAAEAVNKMSDKINEYRAYLRRLNDAHEEGLLKDGEQVESKIDFDSIPQKMNESDEIAATFAIGFMSGGRP